MPRKLGRTSKERNALLRNLASQLLWYGRIETTAEKAKELRSYVEKLITKAVNTYADTIEYEATKKDEKGKEITVSAVKDGPKKLAARRKIMAYVYDLQEQRKEKESKANFKARTENIQHPLLEKMFNEYAPKYAQRGKELGQMGGYTRIIKLGNRRGDAAESAIIELV